jgi:hypothetical protein
VTCTAASDMSDANRMGVCVFIANLQPLSAM